MKRSINRYRLGTQKLYAARPRRRLGDLSGNPYGRESTWNMRGRIAARKSAGFVACHGWGLPPGSQLARLVVLLRRILDEHYGDIVRGPFFKSRLDQRLAFFLQ